jgi:hypothetical protein
MNSRVFVQWSGAGMDEIHAIILETQSRIDDKLNKINKESYIDSYDSMEYLTLATICLYSNNIATEGEKDFIEFVMSNYPKQKSDIDVILAKKENIIKIQNMFEYYTRKNNCELYDLWSKSDLFEDWKTYILDL